ncbi:hypothetical protein VDGL01_04556 [Verticillium dahliae]
MREDLRPQIRARAPSAHRLDGANLSDHPRLSSPCSVPTICQDGRDTAEARQAAQDRVLPCLISTSTMSASVVLKSVKTRIVKTGSVVKACLQTSNRPQSTEHSLVAVLARRSRAKYMYTMYPYRGRTPLL